MTAENSETRTSQTWVESVDAFEKEATWLTGVDKPQLTALRAIAEALDDGTFQAALISQFTLIHRDLVKRRPGEKNGGGAGAPYDTPMTFPEPWRADA